MVDTISLRNEAIEYAKKAVEFEDQKKYEDAMKFYKKAVFNLNIVMENDNNKYNKDTYSKKISEYEDRAKYLSELIESIDNKKNKKEVIGGGYVLKLINI